LNIVLSLLALLFLALVAGAIYLLRQSGLSRQVVLMLILAAIVAANVMIWTLPDSSGEAPIDKLPAKAP